MGQVDVSHFMRNWVLCVLETKLENIHGLS